MPCGAGQAGTIDGALTVGTMPVVLCQAVELERQGTSIWISRGYPFGQYWKAAAERYPSRLIIP